MFVGHKLTTFALLNRLHWFVRTNLTNLKELYCTCLNAKDKIMNYYYLFICIFLLLNQ